MRFFGAMLLCVVGCHRASPAESASQTESEEEQEPQPTETLYRPFPPMALGDLRDDEEQPCGASRIEYVRATTTAQGRYWVLDRESRLFSFDAAFEHRQAHLTNKKVDLIRRANDGSLWAIVNEENRWRSLRRDETGWQHLGDLPAMNRTDDSIGEREGRPALTIQEGETYWFDSSGLVHALSSPFREGPSRGRRNRGRMTLASTSEGTLYVARDGGEFGGSLLRIDVGTANRPPMQKEETNGPMTDIVVDPTDPRCVVSSHGTIHDGGHGLVVRACPGGNTVVFEEMVFKLVANGSAVYALGYNENYAITGRTTHRLAAATYTERCGQLVARVEGLLLMRVPANARRDLRDEVPGLNLFAMPAL